MASPARSSANVLNSWKEIAMYLGRGVRTVERYERNLALPVRRPRGTSRSAVIALKEDLDTWLRRAPLTKTVVDSCAPLPAQSLTLVRTVHKSVQDGGDLRHRCAELRAAHGEIVSRLFANLNGLVHEIHVCHRLKPTAEATSLVKDCNTISS